MRRSLPRIHGENLEGFTVKEEVDPEPYAVDLMRRAREEQKALMKNVSAYTLHNRLDAMAMDDDPARLPLAVMALVVALIVVLFYQFITADLQTFIYFQF